MGYAVQVVVDCSDPHPLADWWAETLGWEVERGDESFIRSMVDQGFATAEDTTTHDGRLVWKVGAAITDPAGPPGTPRVLFQLVPEAKSVKNRLHLDVRAGGDLEEHRAALEARGATFLHVGQQGPSSWITMADPEGNEFCIAV
ncbi:VOC family protein [Sanguibacter sp. 25GB23B1]|uniref:VOC family protein n=1 Tax=unclassified Sanguibacter TaxID=2645534 RepID=UPI0032AF9CAF